MGEGAMTQRSLCIMESWWFQSSKRRLVKTMMGGRGCTHEILYISCGFKARQGEVSDANSLASGQSMSQHL